MMAGAVFADHGPILARLIRGCIAVARVRTVACIHRLADTVKGGEPSYMALVIACDHTAYRSLLLLAGAVLADDSTRRRA